MASTSKKPLKRRKRKSIEKLEFQFNFLPYELQKSIVDKLGILDRLELRISTKNSRKLVSDSGILPKNFIGFEFNPVDKDSDVSLKIF